MRDFHWPQLEALQRNITRRPNRTASPPLALAVRLRMEIWQRQLLGLLASVGWLLAIPILAFIFSYLLGAGNPLRNEALFGVAIPIVYGSPVWLGLAAFIGWKWGGLTRLEIALFGAPVLISLFGLITTLILG